jgi:hypothetical protein
MTELSREDQDRIDAEKFRARRDRARENVRKWREENPDKVRENNRKNYSKKRLAKVAATRQHYIDNPQADRRKVGR